MTRHAQTLVPVSNITKFDFLYTEPQIYKIIFADGKPRQGGMESRLLSIFPTAHFMIFTGAPNEV
jgi:hypothetical protein